MTDAKRDQNFVPTALGVSSVDNTTPIPFKVNPVTGRLLTDVAGGSSGTVQTISIASANGFAGTSDGDPNNPELTLSTTATGILKGNGTAISAVTIGSGLSYDGTTLSASGGTGDVVGPASATDNAVARFDSTTGKLLQNSAMTVDDNGAFIAADTSKVSGNEGGGFGYIVLGIENTNSGGRAELSLDTDDGAFAGFVTMAGSATTNEQRQFDLGTRVAGDIGFWTNDVERITLRADGTALQPKTNDTIALGTNTSMWSDLFLASGGVINFNNSNVLLTHSAGKLTMSGGDLTIQASETPLIVQNTTDTASVEAFSIEGDRATPAANDEVYMSFRLSDSAGNQTSFARIVTTATTVTDASETADLKFQTIASGTLSSRVVLNSTAFRPNANDGIALGSATVSFADLFLASGGVINWANGNVTLTHGTGALTVAGATTVSLGTSAAFTTGTIELGAASDTTLSRSAAGVLAVEGVAVPTVSSTSTLTNKRIQPRTASSTSAATLTPDISTASTYFRTTQTVGLTINAPTGTPVIGETIIIYVDSAGAQTLTIDSTYKAFGAAFPASTTAGKTFMMSCQYNGTDWKTLWANAV